MSDDVMMDTRVHNDEVKKDEERKAQRRAKIATGGATDAIAIAIASVLLIMYVMYDTHKSYLYCVPKSNLIRISFPLFDYEVLQLTSSLLSVPGIMKKLHANAIYDSLSEGFAEILLMHNSHTLASKTLIQILVSINSDSIKDICKASIVSQEG